ncbi:MAG: Pr6Pr family membrane protein [Sphingobacteriales bacterium]|nr:Pr6Pr family membrane protein [Sphingobacteriales bacterium]
MSATVAQKSCQLLGLTFIAFPVLGRYYSLATTVPSFLGDTVWEGFANLSSFLTIWTNILVGIYFFVVAFFPNSRLGTFFQKPTVEKAILSYILFIGIAYHLLLSAIYHPVGMLMVYNIFLHYINPAYFLIYALLFMKSGAVKYWHSLYWLSYLLLYGAYTLVRGEITDFYPYPFANVNALGYAIAMKNFLGIIVSFFVFSNILIFIDYIFGKTSKV